MKIISEKECAKKVEKEVNKFPDVNKLPLWSCWKKIQPIICVIILVFSFLLAVETLKYYKYDIMSLLGITRLSLFWKGVVAIVGFVIVVITMIIMSVIHELIHVLHYKAFKYNCVIVVSKSLTISVLSLNWVKKCHELCGLILPFFTMLMITCILHLIFDNMLVSLWIILINLAISSSDIFGFINILLKTPSNVLLFGHYFRCQQ